MRVALLTAGKDLHYALGLAPALANAGIDLEVVGNDEMEQFPGIKSARIHFVNIRQNQRSDAALREKIQRVVLYYCRLLHFGWQSKAKVFHILWPNKFVYLDRTIVNAYYRSLGKALVFTAHNINTEARDRRDSVLNRFSLRIQYKLAAHVFVHTPQMKDELVQTYGVSEKKITVVQFPINNVTPRSQLDRQSARQQLGLDPNEKTILFFGNIAAYKGLEDLIRAVPLLRSSLGKFRVLVVGSIKKGEDRYFSQVCGLIAELHIEDVVDRKIEYVPEADVEMYFKSADVSVLPYRRIYQSGVLFLSYSFGLPVVVSDAGNLREGVLEGKTGFVCRPGDPIDLAEKLDKYFSSDLFMELDTRRPWIMKYANERYSWRPLADKSREVYEALLRSNRI